MILDLAELSAKNLFRRGKRSWLTIIGIIIGITAIVALFSLGQGLEDSVTQEFNNLGANTIYILPGQGLSGFTGGQSVDNSGLSDSDLEAIRRVQGVDEAGPLIYAQSQGEFRGETERVPLVGIPTDSSQEMILRTNSLELDTGRNIRENDQFSALAGSRLSNAEVFSDEVGLRAQVNVDDNDIRVVGLLKASGDPEYDRSLVLPIDSVRDITGDEERIDFIIAEAQSGQEPEDTAREIEEELRNERNIKQGEENFTVSTADDLIDSLLGILELVQYVVLGIVSIALFVGGLGIMNTMYMSVSERTNEIGIMKALGAKKNQILGIYLFESGILGLIGGAIGIITGLGLTEIAFYLIRGSVNIPLTPSRSPALILTALTLSVILGVVSGFLPARKAAKLEPVEAIRQE